MTANLPGTIWGEEAIPSKWLYELEGRSLTMQVTDELTAVFVDGEPVDTDKYPPR